MGNGYDPEEGELLVPIKLHEQVIQPLQALQVGQTEIKRMVEHNAKTITGHIDSHTQAVQEKEQRLKNRNEAIRKVLISTVSVAIMAIVSLLVSHLGGVSFP